MITLSTNFGNIILELDTDKAPITVENFLSYAKNGYYNGTIFHRVIDGFMIQGGGFDASMKQKATEKPIKNEANNGLKNNKYTIAMARTSIPDSATSQFFINVNNICILILFNNIVYNLKNKIKIFLNNLLLLICHLFRYSYIINLRESLSKFTIL